MFVSHSKTKRKLYIAIALGLALTLSLSLLPCSAADIPNTLFSGTPLSVKWVDQFSGTTKTNNYAKFAEYFDDYSTAINYNTIGTSVTLYKFTGVASTHQIVEFTIDNLFRGLITQNPQINSYYVSFAFRFNDSINAIPASFRNIQLTFYAADNSVLDVVPLQYDSSTKSFYCDTYWLINIIEWDRVALHFYFATSSNQIVAKDFFCTDLLLTPSYDYSAPIGYEDWKDLYTELVYPDYTAQQSSFVDSIREAETASDSILSDISEYGFDLVSSGFVPENGIVPLTVDSTEYQTHLKPTLIVFGSFLNSVWVGCPTYLRMTISAIAVFGSFSALAGFGASLINKTKGD